MQLAIFTLFIITVPAAFADRSTPFFKRYLLPRQVSCGKDQSACSFGGCCPANTTCTIVNNVDGCCPLGFNCGTTSSTVAEAPSSTQEVVEITTPATSAVQETTCEAGFVSCGNGGCCAVTSSNPQPQTTTIITTRTYLRAID